MTTIVIHPAFPDVTRKVDDPAPWIKQGWLPLSVIRGDTAVTRRARKPRKK